MLVANQLKVFAPLTVASLGLGIVSAVLTAPNFTMPALADPPPPPPSNTILPDVFCFRFTDVKAVEDDPEQDRFIFSFEVLNWTDTPASGVRFAMSTGGFDAGKDLGVTGAQVDSNGRPLGSDSDPIPGNQPVSNTGSVTSVSSSAVEYTAGQFNSSLFTENPIPNLNLLDVPSTGGTQAACALVPGCVVSGNTPIISNPETIDDGNNVLDGFSIEIDGFDERDAISFNWFLLDENGESIGSVGNGNAYGFGTVNLFRDALNDTTSDPDFDVTGQLVFPGNTGGETSGRIFAPGEENGVDNVNVVTGFAEQTFVDGLVRPSPSGFSVTGETLLTNALSDTGTEDGPIAVFAAEFGAGITAPFLNPLDNVESVAINVTPNEGFDLTDVSGSDPVPEPATTLATGAVALMGLTLRRWRNQAKQ